MNRPTLALVVGASAAAVLVMALVVGISSRQSPTLTGSSSDEAERVASDAVQPNSSPVDAPQQARNDAKDKTSERSDGRPGERSEDEAYVLEMVKKLSTEETQKNYSLLIEMLDLTPTEIDALFEFLVEDKIARQKTAYSDGLGIDEDERLARLQEILNDEKLQQFLAYERNLADFRELHFVQTMLQENDVPLTEIQRDGLLEILIDVRKQLDPKRPSHIEIGSIADLEWGFGYLDEYDRLATELAPSVLSAKQVEYMFERNQKYSYERASQLEWHKERLAANPDDDMPLWYVPKGD